MSPLRAHLLLLWLAAGLVRIFGVSCSENVEYERLPNLSFHKERVRIDLRRLKISGFSGLFPPGH